MGSCLCNENIYLYGGISSEIMNDMQMYNIYKQEWNLCKSLGDPPHKGRYGHSMNNFKHYIFIFGGEFKMRK